jgi:hypothetical protein
MQQKTLLAAMDGIHFRDQRHLQIVAELRGTLDLGPVHDKFNS